MNNTLPDSQPQIKSRPIETYLITNRGWHVLCKCNNLLDRCYFLCGIKRLAKPWI